MKKILMIFAGFLMLFASNAMAEMKIIDAPQILDKSVKFGALQSLTVCAQGQMFLITYGRSSSKSESESFSISTTQIYEQRVGKSVPMKCKKF